MNKFNEVYVKIITEENSSSSIKYIIVLNNGTEFA